MSKVELNATLLNDPAFKNAMKGLAQEKISFGTAFRIKTILNQVDDAHIKTQQVYLDIVKAHAKLKEDGDLEPDIFKEDIMGPDGETPQFKKGDPIPNSFVIKEDMHEEYKDAMEDFWKEAVVLDADKISIDKFENIEMSALDISVLEPIIEIPEEIKNNVIV